MSWSRFGSRSSRPRSDSWSPWPTYTRVSDRRAQAAVEITKMAKRGHTASPVQIEGKVIARTVWGKAWCKALEAHADLANRLGRGRSYVRHGCVVDLQPSTGLVTALISGSSLYHASITFEPLPAARWAHIIEACRGKIRSLVELLQGKLSTEVMAVVCQPGEGLFPRIGEMKMRCSCPDGAWMCKHLAAVLYGVGHRLDTNPELLFSLRDVDPSELVAAATRAPAVDEADPRSLGDADLSALFGVALDQDAAPLSQLPPSSFGQAIHLLHVAEPPAPPPQTPAAPAAPPRKTTTAATRPATTAPAVTRPGATKPVATTPSATRRATKAPPATKAAAKTAPATKAAAKEPTAKRPAARKPAVKKATAKRPAAGKPAVKKPAVKKPVVQEPPTRTPATRKPAARKPAARKPAARKPAVTRASAEKGAHEAKSTPLVERASAAKKKR